MPLPKIGIPLLAFLLLAQSYAWAQKTPKAKYNAQNEGDLYYNIALDFYSKTQYETAIKVFTECLVHYKKAKASLQTDRSYFYLARCYAQTNQKKKAMQELKKARQLFTASLDDAYEAGRLCQRLAEPKQAIGYYEKTIAIDNTFRQGYEALIQLHEQVGNTGTADKYKEKLKTLAAKE